MATLIIGIGTTGLRVLEAAQQFNYEFLGQNTPSEVEYVFIDTEKASNPRATPLGYSSIDKISIPLDGIQGAVANLRENSEFDSTWFPTELSIAADSGAAGGRPAYGRLAFWVYYNQINARLSSFAQKDGQKTVVVVGSITGGTGSGICIDLAYLIRHRLTNVDLQAVFMIPSASDYNQANKVVFENSFQALRSLEFFSLKENKYKMTTPNGNDISSVEAPYDLTSVISQDYDQNNRAFQASKMKSLPELINSAGLYISSLFLPDSNKNFKGILEERRTDAKESYEHLKHFSSFGISMAQYPKRLLEEFVALDFSANITKYWESHNIKNNTTEIKAKNLLDKHIKNAIDNSLNIIINNKPLGQYTSFIKDQIINKKYEGHTDAESYLDSLFLTNGLIFTSLKNNISNARNNIILDINRDLKTLLKEPILLEADKFLKAVSGYLDVENNTSMLKFWHSTYKLNGSPQVWLSLYKFLKDKLFSGRNSAKLFLQDDPYITERLEDMVYILKMNLLMPELEKIGKAVLGSNPLYADGQSLISILDIKELREALQKLLNPEEPSSFSTREEHIKANNTSYAQIYYYYRQNDFDGEVQNLKNVITGQGQSFDTTGKHLLNGKSLIDFLCEGNSFKPKATTTLYYDILPDIVGQISKILSTTENGDRSIYNLISNSQNAISKYITAEPDDLATSPPAFINHANIKDIRGLFQSSPCLKMIYIADNINRLNQTTPNNVLSKDNSLELPYLKDTVIVFREYSYYGNFKNILDNTLIPTRDIESLTIIKKTIIENIDNEEFIIDRLPYFNQKRNASDKLNIKAEIEKKASHDTSK